VCDLALEGIFALPYFKEVHSETKAFITFIRNHQSTLAAWRQMSTDGLDEEAAKTAHLQLLKPGDTRFASALIMLERTLVVKAKLQQFVVCDRWNAAIAAMKPADRETAEAHKGVVLSAAHWAATQQAVTVCEPIIKLLRLADGDTPSTGKIHYYAFKVSQHLQGEGCAGLPASVRQQVCEIWKERWDYMDSPMHGAAYCLDPEFLGDAGLGLSNIRDGCVKSLRTMIDRLLPGDEDAQQAARMGYQAFRHSEGEFGDAAARKDAPSMPAHQWWDSYGCSAPELQRVAIRVLSQVSSACSCERNWSAYDFIHNKRRNRLTADRARDLVYVFTNGRLADKMQRSGGEPFLDWDEEESDGEGSQP